MVDPSYDELVKQDKLKLRTNIQVLNQLNPHGGEILMTCNVVKICSRFNMRKNRNLIITNFMVYDFSNLKLKRSIQITDLICITKVMHRGSSQFILHNRKEKKDYETECGKDYKLESMHMDEIIGLVSYNYKLINQHDLPIIEEIK